MDGTKDIDMPIQSFSCQMINVPLVVSCTGASKMRQGKVDLAERVIELLQRGEESLQVAFKQSLCHACKSRTIHRHIRSAAPVVYPKVEHAMNTAMFLGENRLCRGSYWLCFDIREGLQLLYSWWIFQHAMFDWGRVY